MVPWAFDDGLGVRHLETDSSGRLVEVLDVAPVLAAHREFEGAIHAQAALVATAAIDGVACVRGVDRRGAALRIVADHVDGVRLPDLLHETIKGNVPLTQPAALELMGRMLRVVAALHRTPGLSHGAITPSHVVITRAGGVVLTDAAFGPALEALQRNREQLWREFRLALPASATLPRFDQRADVTQLGATVLAIALGRSLREGEYPRAINEAVIAATLAARPGETGTSTSALRMWLQQALHLHPRAVFASAVDAEQAYDEVLAPAVERRGGAASLEASLRRIFNDDGAPAAAPDELVAWSQNAAAHHAATLHSSPSGPLPPVPAAGQGAAETVRAIGTMLRSVFPHFRAS